MFANRLRALIPKVSRNISTSLARQGGHHDEGGIPGSNLPFRIDNRFRLTAYFILFFGSGFAVPFVMVRHQLLKK